MQTPTSICSYTKRILPHGRSGGTVWASDGLVISWLLFGTHVSNGANCNFWQLPTQKTKTRWATSTTSSGLAIGHFSVAHRKPRTPVYCNLHLEIQKSRLRCKITMYIFCLTLCSYFFYITGNNEFWSNRALNRNFNLTEEIERNNTANRGPNPTSTNQTPATTSDPQMSPRRRCETLGNTGNQWRPEWFPENSEMRVCQVPGSSKRDSIKKMIQYWN